MESPLGGHISLNRDLKVTEEPVLRKGEGTAFWAEGAGLVLRFLWGPGVLGLRQDEGEMGEARRGNKIC